MIRKSVLTAAALTGAICVSTISNAAAATYSVDIAVGASSSVTGFIQTDCTTTCTLQTADITNFSLSLNIGANPAVVLTPSNSSSAGFQVIGNDLTANATGIFFNFGATDGGTVEVSSPPGGVAPLFCLSSNINSCNPPTPLIFITTGPDVFAEADPGAVNLQIATASSASTPVPAALPLFATGLGALGLLGWRRKRKAQAVT